MSNTEHLSLLPAPPVERRLAAILSADVASYSRLMGVDEVATVRMLTANIKIRLCSNECSPLYVGLG